MINTTKGSIRNWERNGLINRGVKRYERRIYLAMDIERMKLIDLMLQIGFSMSCIKRFFVLYDMGNAKKAVESIKSAPNDDDILTAADHWITMLNLHEEHSKQILELLEQKSI